MAYINFFFKKKKQEWPEITRRICRPMTQWVSRARTASAPNQSFSFSAHESTLAAVPPIGTSRCSPFECHWPRSLRWLGTTTCRPIREEHTITASQSEMCTSLETAKYKWNWVKTQRTRTFHFLQTQSTQPVNEGCTIIVELNTSL